MNASRFHTGSLAFALLLSLAACGCGGDSSPLQLGHGSVSTLAYVVSHCHENSKFETASQRLEVARGDGAPVTVAEIPTFGRLPALGLCPLYGAFRAGSISVFGFAFQRLGVSPDGSGVVFEVNFRNSIVAGLVRDPLTPEQEGIFFVGADNRVRKLGPPSGEPAQRLGGIPSPTMPTVATYSNTTLPFSPDGKTIVFPDRGPGPAGEDAAQVVVLDIAKGTRTAVTQLPATAPDPSNPTTPAIYWYGFIDDETIGFSSRANPADPTHPDGLNPEGIFRTFTVKKDGTGLMVFPEFVPQAIGGGFVPVPTITNPVRSGDVGALSVMGTPLNLPPFLPYDAPVSEIFVTAPDHTLQLTNFGRFDTGAALVSSDGQRVFFTASANPSELHNSNPSENYQIFSISVLGNDLRQLTHFRAADHSTFGCYAAVPLDQPGCFIDGLLYDPQTQTLLFDSSCDPFGTNPAGDQIFAMHPDGMNLHELTAVQGVTPQTDGSVDVELPGPVAITQSF